MKASNTRRMVLAIGVVAMAACFAPDITGPARQDGSTLGSADALLGGGGSGPKLVSCPTNGTVSSSAVVGPLGGIVSAGGTSISIPLGALLEPVTVNVTVPASNYMEVDISVAGAETFNFAEIVTVTIDYSRCNSMLTALAPLTAWHIDVGTHELLEAMPSIDNKLTRTVTFTTTHLSGYALAN